MFRTSGYFRGINCPFFASGLCERPYCHFRHVKVEDGEDKSVPKSQITATGPSTSTQNSAYLENLSDGQFPLTSSSLKQSVLQEDEQNNRDGAASTDKKEPVEVTDNSVKYNKYTGEPIIESEQPPLKFSINKYTGELVPEEVGAEEYSVLGVTVNKYTGKSQGSNGVSHSTDDVTESDIQERKWKDLLGTTLPTYKPTPLTELKKRNANPSLNKYSLSCSEQTSSNQEYDPESNYSTKTFISHTLPVRQVDDRPSSYSSKRSVSYDPSNHEYKHPVKKQRTLSLQCEDSKFSSEDEEEEEGSSNHKSGYKLSNEKEDNKYSLKDAKFFEKLLDHHENTESNDSLDSLDSLNNDDHTTVFKSKKLNSAKQKSLKDRTNLELNIKNSVKDHKHKNSSNSGSSKTSHVDNSETLTPHSIDQCIKSSSHHRKTDSRSHHCEKDSAGSESKTTVAHKPATKLRKSQEIDTKSLDKSVTRHSSAKSRHSSSGSHQKSSHHENTETKKSSHHENTESKKIEKHSSKTKVDYHTKEDNHAKGDNCTKSSNQVKDSKGDNHTKNSKGDNAKSKSNKDATHHKHSSSKNGEKHKDTTQHKHSSSKNGESSKHKSDKIRADTNSTKSSTSKEKPEKIRRNSSELTKQKIVNINVDLFGADSDDSTDAVENSSVMSDYDIDYSALINEEFSDEDRYEECLRIFKETQASPKKKDSDRKKLHVSPVKNSESVSGKKRVAHKADTEVKRKTPEVVKHKLSPAQVMHNRFLELQKRAREAAAAAAAEQKPSSSSVFGEKKRTAHHVSSSPSAKRSNSSTSSIWKNASSSSSKPEKAITISTASKTEKRKAHMPSKVANLARPTIPTEFGSKVPSNIRQRYLNMIIDECLKLCNTEQEAYDRGLEEESAVYKRSSSKTVYLNVAVNTIKRLRTELSEMTPSTSKKVKHNNVLSLSHEAVLGGKNATKTTFTVNRSGGGNKLPQENYKGAELYKRLSTYILTEQQLRDNGFPRESPDIPGDAVFFTESKRKINSSKLTNYEKLCVRCGKTFIVYPNGTYANKEECTHHWGKAWKKRIAGTIDTRYTCCQGDLSSEGCQVAKAHVHETNKWDNLSGYMKTFPCSPPIDGDYGVFAMDCEMVYTKAGVELARVTVTDPDNECVYESLVKPDKPVLDYNTRFSGLTEEDLNDVTTSLRDVQAVLLSLFSDKTIVIGHSLESDFSAVKLIHNTVVDTSVVFPHKMGPPYKRALKTLMAEFLKKIIQDDIGGHDSKEDATSCMELMHLKIKEDARKEPRRK